jgi:hypothetical protein
LHGRDEQADAEPGKRGSNTSHLHVLDCLVLVPDAGNRIILPFASDATFCLRARYTGGPSCRLQAREGAMWTVIFGIVLSAATCLNVAALVIVTS